MFQVTAAAHKIRIVADFHKLFLFCVYSTGWSVFILKYSEALTNLWQEQGKQSSQEVWKPWKKVFVYLSVSRFLPLSTGRQTQPTPHTYKHTNVHCYRTVISVKLSWWNWCGCRQGHKHKASKWWWARGPFVCVRACVRYLGCVCHVVYIAVLFFFFLQVILIICSVLHFKKNTMFL